MAKYNARENLLSLYRRKGFEQAPVCFNLWQRIGRTSCVFLRVGDTAKSDNGASVKSLAG